MHPKSIRYFLGICLLAGTIAAAGHASPSWFEAYGTGAGTKRHPPRAGGLFA